MRLACYYLWSKQKLGRRDRTGREGLTCGITVHLQKRPRELGSGASLGKRSLVTRTQWEGDFLLSIGIYVYNIHPLMDPGLLPPFSHRASLCWECWRTSICGEHGVRRSLPDSALMSPGVYVREWTCSILWEFCASFPRNSRVVFHSACISLHFHRPCAPVPISPHLCVCAFILFSYLFIYPYPRTCLH